MAGRELYLEAIGNSSTAECVWVRTDVSVPDSSSRAYTYSCGAVAEVASQGMSQDLGIAAAVLGVMIVMLGSAALSSFLLLGRNRHRRDSKVSAELALSSKSDTSPPSPSRPAEREHAPPSTRAPSRKHADRTPSRKRGWRDS